MSSYSTIYLGDNTHVVEVIDLKDPVGVVQEDATVAMTSIINNSGVAVSGVTVPLDMPHVADGLYRANLPPGGAFVRGHLYRATFHASGSQGFVAEWTEILTAEIRTA